MNRKDPLRKRIWRDIKKEKSKYIPIFVFFVLMVGLVSGMQVASSSMTKAYDDGIKKYNMEDGNFALSTKIETSELEKVNSSIKEQVSIEEQFYYNCTVNNLYDGCSEDDEYSLKIYKNREHVNTASIFKGTLPKEDNEIAIDRLFAKTNDLEIGDTLHIYEKDYEICGIVALPDYSSLFKSNTDMMFNASTFTFAIVSDNAFNTFPEAKKVYGYTWVFENEDITDNKAYEASDELMEALVANNVPLTDFIKRQDNKGITFAREDIGKDGGIVLIFLYIMTGLLAFIFSVIISSTIEKEATVIGTLRASGYKKSELIRHYMTAPMLVTFVAAIIGNILGYTFFNTLMANMYYNSYSLVKYNTVWNANAFVLTTIIPLVILAAINFLSLASKLSLAPLKFLRRDLSKRSKKKVLKLPDIKFLNRFRIRVLLQNIPNYITMMIGIMISNILFMFCAFMMPWLDNYTDKIVDTAAANYQYVLKNPIELSDDDAEKYCTASLECEGDEVVVFGVADNSKYFKNMELPQKENEIIVSDTFLEFYKVNVGDTVTLSQKYTDKKFDFVITGSHKYAANLAVFVSIDSFNHIANLPDGYFSGYLSDTPLDIDTSLVVSVITPNDLMNLSNQMKNSIGGVVDTMQYACIILYTLIVFLLAKVVLERNANSISLTKILGYSTKEIGKIYIVSTAIAVIISVLLSIPVCNFVLGIIAKYLTRFFGVWIELYIPTYLYIVMVSFGIICYGLISIFHLRKINKIPMEEALKNAE